MTSPGTHLECSWHRGKHRPPHAQSPPHSNQKSHQPATVIAQKPAKSPEKQPDTATQPPRVQCHPDGQAATHPFGHLPLVGLFMPLVTWKSSLASSASLPHVSRGVTHQTSSTATHQPWITTPSGTEPMYHQQTQKQAGDCCEPCSLCSPTYLCRSHIYKDVKGSFSAHDATVEK